MHEEYQHQKFAINQDGTISLQSDPDWVLGTDERSKRVRFVKKGSKNQFVFDQAADYLLAKSKGDGQKSAGVTLS